MLVDYVDEWLCNHSGVDFAEPLTSLTLGNRKLTLHRWRAFWMSTEEGLLDVRSNQRNPKPPKKAESAY